MGTTPLRLQGVSGDIQEMTTGQEAYLAYLAGLQLAAATVSDPGMLTLSATGNTSIGTYSNTFYNQAVGTHPGTSLSIGTTNTTVYQKTGTASEAGANFHRPLQWDDTLTGIQQMDDTDFNTCVDRLISTIFTNEYPGAIRLGSSSPGGDWSTFISGVFSDTRTDGTTITYNLYKRATMTSPVAYLPCRIENTYDIRQMSAAEAQESFGQRAKTRIMSSADYIGAYQLRSSVAGAPTAGGTWLARGTATDTRNTTADVNYTRNSTVNYQGIYTRNSTSNFAGIYTRDSTVNYQGIYTRNSTNTFDGAYTRNSTNTFDGTYVGNYTTAFAGTYVGNYTTNFAGIYAGNYTTNFAGIYTRNSTSDYAGDFLGNFTGDYIGDYAGEFTGDYIGNYLGNFTGDYVGNFLGNYTGDFVGNTNYTRISTRISTRNRAVYRPPTYIAPYPSFPGGTSYYLGNFLGNFTGDFVGDTNYTRISTRDTTVNYAGIYTRDSTVNFAGIYSRNSTTNFASDYTRNSITIFTGDFLGNYTGDYVGDYIGNYTGDYVGDYLGNYSGTYTGDFLGNYTGTYTGDFLGNYTGTYTGDFLGNYTGDYVGNYLGNYTGDYVGDFLGNYTGDYVGDYLGNFAGETIQSANAVIETYTLYVRTA